MGSVNDQRTGEVLEKARLAQGSARALAKTSSAERDGALTAMAAALVDRTTFILEANAEDVREAEERGTAPELIDRLMLTADRIVAIADALLTLARATDPIGTVVEGRSLYNGIRLTRVRVPLGVVAMIYEARPNVTADAAGLCIKTANACILRGGSLANRSNIALTEVLYEAACSAGMPEHCIQSIVTTDRAASEELMSLHGLIDVLIPRGGADLIRTCVENAKVPVIETGTGNCHIYVHEAADPVSVIPIIINAKCQRPGVCNAAESLLIDKSVAVSFLPAILEALTDEGVTVHADELSYRFGTKLDPVRSALIVPATEDDWGLEYLAPEISIRCVDGLDEAIDHINTYGSKHSEAILSEDYEAVMRFTADVDAAAVYANASTRFTDGGEFGLGAEIGISTQKLHARGPMGLDALTSTKFILLGEGQIR